MIRALAAIITIVSAPVAGAETLHLSLPIDCTIGETCFVEDYVDQDPDAGRQRDFACGFNARDAHKGTDFALLSFEAMNTGVDVLAAAPGQVLRTRDGMADDRLMRGVTSDTACGNAVLIEHTDGWQTLYCHMKQGSVRVQPGDTVNRGAPLGQVGLSGQTTHPHVHVTLYRDGQVVDPMNPDARGSCNSATPASAQLFDPPLSYTRTGLVTAGFADHVPSFDDVRSGAARLPETTHPTRPLVVYAHSAFAEHGDLLTLSATGPDGLIFQRKIVLKSPQTSTMRAFGKKAPNSGWPTGDYLGEALLTRKGKVIAHRFAHVTVTRP